MKQEAIDTSYFILLNINLMIVFNSFYGHSIAIYRKKITLRMQPNISLAL